MRNRQLNIEELKGHFYDLLLEETISRETIVAEFLQRIQHFLTAISVNHYVYDEYNHQFVLTSNVDKHPILHNINDTMPFFPLLQEGKVYTESHTSSQLIYIPIRYNEKHDELLSINIITNEPLNLEWEHLAKVCEQFLSKLTKLIELSDGERRSKLLYKVTSKFHSTMDTEEVLSEIISTLKEEYPNFTYYLLLSHDHTNSTELPIKELQYDDSNISAAQAYVTGEIQLEDSMEDKTSSLYAPLKGKQGVYGVLQVISSNSLIFPNEEVKFISLLAQTAGSALENAKLYQQSKQLISDLQLINETSHQLNSNLRLNEAMNYMSQQIIESFDAMEVGFILFDNNGSPTLLPGSTDYFTSDSHAQLLIQYLYDQINKEKEAMFVGDVKLNEIPCSFRSVMAVPMIQEGILRGIATVLHKESYFFTFETFKLVQSLIYHSTLAVTNSMLREELENLVITDFLTKLHTRKYLNESIEKSMEADAFGTFLLIDIDNFKQVNDTYGHQVGDEILKQVALIIKDNIREFDIGARWGGEELSIYLPRVDIQAGVAVANRLVQRVEQLTKPNITISCGVSHWKQGQPDNPVTLFKRADEALYLAKETGKNRVNVQLYIGN
ncbi:sensor domain-containing diguanylate cyclase [Bacillus suaedaesalsae]|uniref:Diguanylate cyclase n=1 Tax=Bacillus suaedaesalsae TaxID=2810349 RepID=A0ABS2DD94_9BACI|nr:sensor domain-containing diguanylate cyclase [Bacillus suaedaesalsae]MBM6616430.1 diguanylate cyclase [Bacillus suaedaesalsae]